MLAPELAIIESLDREFQVLIKKVIDRGQHLCQGTRYRVTVTSYTQPSVAGWRTAEQQNAYFKQNLSSCDGYEKLSHHQFGRALHLGLRDVDTGTYIYFAKMDAGAMAIIMEMVATAEALGLVWGGRWKKTRHDPEHYQMSGPPQGIVPDPS